MEPEAAVTNLDGPCIFVQADSFDLLTGLCRKFDQAEIRCEVALRVDELGSKIRRTSPQSDLCQAGPHVAAFTVQNMALQTSPLFANQRETPPGIATRGSLFRPAKFSDVPGDLPDLALRHVVGRHLRFREPVADDAIQGDVGASSGQNGCGKIRAFAAIAGRTMASGAAPGV
jgi:hypothetical protein